MTYKEFFEYMTYEEFIKFVQSECVHEAIYEDSERRTILVITMLDAYSMVGRAQRPWVGLTDEEIKAVNAQVSQIPPIDYTTTTYAKAIEAKLKEKNNAT